MTIANTNVKSVYNGNGVTREWNLGFHYNSTLSSFSIVVTHEDGTSETVTANYELDGTVLTYPTVESELDPLPVGDVLTITRITPLTQSINLVQQGPLDAETLESGYDKLTMEVQEVKQTVTENIADINTVAENISNVNTVATNISNVNAVVSNATNINTVASDIANVNAVGSNIENVNAVNDNSANINAVVSNSTNINTVAGISSDVTNVASISNAIQAVDANEANVNLVASNLANVNTVAGNMNSVLTTAGDIANINTVAGDKTNIDTVAGISSNVTTVAGIYQDVSTVAEASTDVSTVASNVSDVSTVATNISNVNSAVSNMASIIAAPTAATNAANSATTAQKWAEGSDADVTPLGGTKSAKGWATRAQEIAESIGAIYKPAGSIAFASLPALSADVLGNVYNITDAFTTTADFVEGAGNNYPAGANVAIVDVGTGGSHSYKFDVLSGFVDLSAYRTSAAQDVIDSTKQATLVSGTNIKTVNSTSLLGSGDITIDSLPSQTGQSGKFLTTDGTNASWAATPTEIPSQSGQSGKFLTTDGTDLSWANAGGSSLPSQAGNSGKFLTTDGTDASWGDALKNTATGTNSLTLIGSATAKNEAVNIGLSSSAGTNQNVAIGTYAQTSGDNISASGATGASTTAVGFRATASTGTAIGSCTDATKGVAIGRGRSTTNKVTASAEGSIAIGTVDAAGTYCKATKKNAIQLGAGTNATQKQFQVYEYPMLDGTTGLIPVARIPDLSGTYLPTTSAGVANGVASLDNSGKIPSSQLPYKAGNGIKISEKQFSDFYTTVGTPTNNNGVISDLDENNYVHLTNKIQSISYLRTLKVHTVFMASALSNASVVFAIGAYNMKFNVRNDNKFYFQYRPLSAPNTLQTDSSSAVTIPLNSEIEVDLFYTKDTSATLVVQSGGNVLWNHSTSDITITDNDDFMFGTDHTYFGGQYISIDLNKTNVQVNGEYIVYDINSTYIDEEGYTLIDTYSNGSSWYKVFAEKQADGTLKKWCEQGGHFSVFASTAAQTVNLLKQYADTNYNLQVSLANTGTAYTSNAGASYWTACNKTASSFELYSWTDARLADKDWRACGYLA